MQETILSVLSDKKKSEEGKEEEELELVVPPPCRTRSPTGSRRVTPTTATVEKVLPNGDLYMGEFLWERAAWSWEVFVVEWVHVRRGMEERESEWEREAFMAIWSDLRRRSQVWENGWVWNLQDGEGRYTWSNGNEYVGEWKSGVISGKGVFVLANGDKYDMSWENGVPKWEREGCAGLSCAVGLLPPVSASAKGVKREREGLCSSVR
uniref:Uncharacterized protein n=1 Tax=Fagus sylvatica TaxID=28930 RepID=A0A2N9FI73_FAGSY